MIPLGLGGIQMNALSQAHAPLWLVQGGGTGAMLTGVGPRVVH